MGLAAQEVDCVVVREMVDEADGVREAVARAGERASEVRVDALAGVLVNPGARTRRGRVRAAAAGSEAADARVRLVTRTIVLDARILE